MQMNTFFGIKLSPAFFIASELKPENTCFERDDDEVMMSMILKSAIAN